MVQLENYSQGRNEKSLLGECLEIARSFLWTVNTKFNINVKFHTRMEGEKPSFNLFFTYSFTCKFSKIGKDTCLFKGLNTNYCSNDSELMT